MKGLRYVIDIKKSDKQTFMDMLHELVKKRIIKAKNTHLREEEECLRFFMDIKEKDEKVFMDAILPLIQKGIIKTENVHMREQEVR